MGHIGHHSKVVEPLGHLTVLRGRHGVRDKVACRYHKRAHQAWL